MSEDTIDLAIITLFASFIFIILLSLLGRRSSKRKKLYEKIKSKGLKGLKDMSWQEFEHYCAYFFELDGYAVTMCGLGGADGGIDLIIKKKGKKYLVQCKHWKSKVGVGVVREMFGVMAAERFDGVYIVSIAGYTRSAEDWARGKPIKLLCQNHII